MLDETYNLIIFLLNKLSKSLPIKRIFSVRDIFMELDNWNPIDSYHAKRFDEVLVNKIEPYFKKLGGIIFLKDYPVEACALAKISGDKHKIAERWELYLDGLEIANAYSELTDPEEQRKRFVSCQNKRLQAGQVAYEIDEEFIQSLNNINEAGGCALGVDRLLAWICNEDNIDNFVYRDIFK